MNKAANDLELRALVARCAMGDQKALASLHDALASRIFAFAVQRVRAEDEARTVVIDTLYQVWRDAARFRGDSQVSTWVLGIARFKALTLLRNSGRSFEDIDDHADTLASNTPGPEGELCQWQEARQVGDCLDRLSEVHRECLQLVYYEALPLAEVAKVQQVPENTIKTRLFHARKNMRACVEQHA